MTFEQTLARIDNDFDYHPPTSSHIAHCHELVRAACKQLAQEITSLTPPGREQSLALTNVEQAMFWANAAIARNQGEK